MLWFESARTWAVSACLWPKARSRLVIVSLELAARVVARRLGVLVLPKNQSNATVTRISNHP